MLKLLNKIKKETMIYTQDDINEEKQLISNRLARNTLRRNYPAQYLEEITSIMDKFFNLFQFEPNPELLTHSKVLEAFEVANIAHSGQLRKITEQDYMVHLREVATFLSAIPGNTYEEVVAGLLHDVVEKGNISLEFIKENFGQNVYDHVYYLTDQATPEDGNRDSRIIKNWEHFSKCPPKTNNIKALDILSNTKSTMLCDARYGKTYLEPIVELMNPYFQNCEYLDPQVKKMFSDMTELSLQIIKLQNTHNISQLEKTYANKVKSEKKKAGLSI